MTPRLNAWLYEPKKNILIDEFCQIQENILPNYVMKWKTHGKIRWQIEIAMNTSKNVKITRKECEN